MTKILERPWLVAFFILLISWLTVRGGIAIGEATVPPGAGYLQKSGITENLGVPQPIDHRRRDRIVTEFGNFLDEFFAL